MANTKKNQTNVTNQMKKRSVVLTAMALACFCVVVVHMFVIQIVRYEEYKGLATQIQLREVEVSAKRGSIYDANMKVLAQTATVWTITVSPADSKEEQHQVIADGLSEIVEVDKETILSKLAKKESYYQLIKQKVDKPVADKVNRFCQENELVGVYVVEDYKRYYPYGEFASTILGFCGSDNQGLAGLESYYDDELSGENGRIIAAKNGWGYDMVTASLPLLTKRYSITLKNTLPLRQRNMQRLKVQQVLL